MKKYVRIKACFALIVITVCMAMPIIHRFFQNDVKLFIKSRVSSKVCEKKDELLQIVLELEKDKECTFIVHNKASTGNRVVYYKDLDDSRLTKLFRQCWLLGADNRMDEKGMIWFPMQISYVTTILTENEKETYKYGVYYSDDDTPRDAFSGDKCEKQFTEKEWTGVERNYVTERITENWWYYEETESWRDVYMKR